MMSRKSFPVSGKGLATRAGVPQPAVSSSQGHVTEGVCIIGFIDAVRNRTALDEAHASAAARVSEVWRFSSAVAASQLRRDRRRAAESENGSRKLAWTKSRKSGGEGGIRTHVPVTRQDAFEASPLRPLRYLSVAQNRAKRTLYYSPPPAGLSS